MTPGDAGLPDFDALAIEIANVVDTAQFVLLPVDPQALLHRQAMLTAITKYLKVVWTKRGACDVQLIEAVLRHTLGIRAAAPHVADLTRAVRELDRL